MEENQEKQNPILYVGIATAAIVLVATYLLARGQREKISQGVNETDKKTQNIATQNSSDEEGVIKEATELAEESGVKIFEITGGAFFFKPNEIGVKKGETVRIVFTNSGGIHDFVIDEFNVKTKLVQSGKTADVEFVANEVGEFVFYCSVSNHRALGMKGTLIVE